MIPALTGNSSPGAKAVCRLHGRPGWNFLWVKCCQSSCNHLIRQALLWCFWSKWEEKKKNWHMHVPMLCSSCESSRLDVQWSKLTEVVSAVVRGMCVASAEFQNSTKTKYIGFQAQRESHCCKSPVWVGLLTQHTFDSPKDFIALSMSVCTV